MVDFNPFSSEMRDNPHPFYATMRRESPMFFDPALNLWHVFCYDDVRSVLRNPAAFSSEIHRVNLDRPVANPSMLQSDPPRHTRLRALVSRAFTPRMVGQMEPRIYRLADDLLDQALPRGQIDLVDDLAYPLPVIVIAEMLGIPPEDRAHFRRWSDEIAAALGTGVTGTPMDVRPETFEHLRAYFTEAIARHRAEPQDDLIGALLEAELEGEKLSMEDLLSFCILLLVAGNETTTNLISNAVRCFLEFPAALAQVRANPQLLPQALEEVLRFRSPVQATIRLPNQATTIAGHEVKAGQPVLAWLASANMDEAEFVQPYRFQIARQPNRHLSFGAGIHFCLGAPLARLEAKAALERFLARAISFERVDGTPLDPVGGFIMHGVKHLPMSVAYRRASV